ncbi:hypothetical protein EAb13_CDS0034 [Acinetobacter phage EAb13]|nr:hypothetical protein EAb13_CDS0034 [Acinetobacter phage EAb13]
MNLTYIRAYPISTLIQVLDTEKVKKAIAEWSKHAGIGIQRCARIEKMLFTILYLKQHFEENTGGSKPLATMADKHKEMIIEFYKELLQINSSQVQLVSGQAFISMLNVISEEAENIEDMKKASEPRVAERPEKVNGPANIMG